MATTADYGQITGTKDRHYDLVWYLEACLDNALRLEQYCADAQKDGDEELVELFTKAQADSKKGAELAKKLLAKRLSS